MYLCVAVSALHTHEHGDEGHEEEPDHEGPKTANLLFENNGDGTFANVTDEAGVGDPNNAVTHTAVWGDYNRDGWLDLFVCNLGSDTEGTAAPSRLFHNNGDGTFSDMTTQAGLAGEIYAFNAMWVDINNDGHLDLHIIYHPSHEDFPAGVLVDFPHPLYLSDGDGTFTNINEFADQAIYETGIIDISHLIGLAWADADTDGDMDCVITENHGDGPLRLYRNERAAEGNHWIEIELRQDGDNPFAVGAQITLRTGHGEQVRAVGVGNSGWGCQAPLVQHFGLGEEGVAVVDVRWPDGTRESFGSLSGNGTHLLERGGGTNVPVPDWHLY